MTEIVIVQQKADFATEIRAAEAHDDESDDEGIHYHYVKRLSDVTPYGMFLASLGSCTAVVLHTYAHNHGLHLHEVEIRLDYHRIFREDCENCEDVRPYEEHIREEIALRGDLNESDREKLFKIGHQCPIHKMLKSGIEIRSQLAVTA
jgi:uncharacterized OsmC-like protein